MDILDSILHPAFIKRRAFFHKSSIAKKRRGTIKTEEKGGSVCKHC